MGGSFSKLWCEGGDAANHSSVWASHGFDPAGTGLRHDTHRLTRKSTNDTPIKNAPAVDSWFMSVQPTSEGYVATRRGMPRSPTSYWVMNVSQKPTVSNQKCHL